MPAFPLHACTGEDAACFSKGPFGQKTIVVGGKQKKRCHRLLEHSGFSRELVHHANRKKNTKTQILAPGLKCEKGGGNKREFELNEHALVA